MGSAGRTRVALLRLNEDEAIDTLLVRAIESEDHEAAVLTREDRQYASTAALGSVPIGETADAKRTAAFLARRAELALSRLLVRYPTLRRVCRLSRWPGWVNWIVPAAAFILGLSSNILGGERLNILAFPLLGLIAWNFAIYLLLLVHAAQHLISRRHEESEGPMVKALEWLIRPANARLAAQPTLERGVVRYANDWAKAARPLTGYRVARTLHLGSAMLATGILIGMLLRARYTADYQAGWSGTWAGAEHEIARVLGVILGPASAVTGIALPSAERLRALRGGSENAGDWLILWTVTAALLVIIPRLLLALLSGIQAMLLRRRLPVPNDFYLRSVLRAALGRPGSARVVPYSFEVGADARDRLERLLTAALGEKTAVRTDRSVPYGDEDEWLAREGAELTNTDQLILLFNLASTPEAENHGAFVAGVRERLTGAGTSLLVILDDSALRHRLRGQPSAERRLNERVQAWSAVLGSSGVTPMVINLDSTDEAESARTLERAFLRTPVPA